MLFETGQLRAGELDDLVRRLRQQHPGAAFYMKVDGFGREGHILLRAGRITEASCRHLHGAAAVAALAALGRARYHIVMIASQLENGMARATTPTIH